MADQFETTMECNITNPSQLQEVTLDPDATNYSYMGMRSPGAPTGGRSVKEIDEQLTNLKKENFDLKLRIYFLEERIGANFDTDKEDAIKKNIELRVELESVRKDLEEKQDLLCQAAKAMEIEEEERKREIETKDEHISKLEAELLAVKSNLQGEINLCEEKELKLCAQAFDLNRGDEVVNNLKTQIFELQNELQKEQEQSGQFDYLMDISEYARTRCKELEGEIELKNNKLEAISMELKDFKHQLSACQLQVSVLENEMLQKSTKLQYAMNQLQQKEIDIKQRKLEVKEIKKKSEFYLMEKIKWEKGTEKINLDYQQLSDKYRELQQTNANLIGKLHMVHANGAGSSVQQVATQDRDQEVEQNSLPKAISKMDVLQLKTSSPSSPTKLLSNPPTQTSEIVLQNISETNLTSSSNETNYSQEKYLELQKDHFKACKMLKNMIQKRKECEQNIQELRSSIAEKDRTISYLQKALPRFDMSDQLMQTTKPIHEMVTEKKLTACINPADTKQSSMEAEETHLVDSYKELVEELEIKIEVLTATLNEKDLQLEQFKIDVQEKSNQITDLEFELLALNEDITHNSSNEKEDHETEKDLDCSKDQQIEKLENKLRQRTCDLQGLVNKELWEKNRSIEKMQNILKSKDAAINTLQKNMESKEMQLKILKDKINELGVHVKLPSSLLNTQSPTQIDTPDDLTVAKNVLKICLEERIQLVKEIEELQCKINNIPEHDENHQLKQLTTDYEGLQEELEKTEKLRQESQEICLLLTSRLEELCCFLNSLLKQKCVLGFLSNEQVIKLQGAINKSLDLSQTLSTSLLLNPDQSLLQLNDITNLLNSTTFDYDIIEKSAIQDDDKSVLSIIPSDIKLTYSSHLNISVGGNNEQEEVIKILRQQISNLKHEIELRDVEFGKKLNEPTDLVREQSECQAIIVSKNNKSAIPYKKQRESDSESWSEPDRSVSLARMGILDESIKSPTNTSIARLNKFTAGTTKSTESTEDENASHCIIKTPKRTTLAESRQTVISLHEQVCELEEKLKESENQLLTAQVATAESENLLKREQIKIAEIKKDGAVKIIELNKQLEVSENCKKHLEDKIEEANREFDILTRQINEKNKLLDEFEGKQAAYNQKIAELEKVATSLEEYKKNLAILHGKNKEMQNTINELEIEKQKAIESAINTKVLLEKAAIDVEMTQADLKNMQKREQEIREELDQSFQITLKNAEEQYINSVKSIERNYESQINKYQENVIKMKEEYEKNYIKHTEVNKHLVELAEVRKEVEGLKYFIRDYENKIRLMEEKELQYKTKVQDMQREHHDKIYQLHSELDNATLQYSEALLEKTKLQNDNTCLEQKVQNLCLKESDLMKELTNLNKESKECQNNLCLQIAQLDHKNALLEIKVHELESSNTELLDIEVQLRNYIMRLQKNNSISGRILSTSLPTCSGTILDLFANKSLPVNIPFNSTHALSDNSGYTSEDVIGDDLKRNKSLPGNKAILEADQDRLCGNASPDLGIESDQGRLSSMECNANLPRPILPTLELTASMNSLLDPIQDITCTNDQCCTKTKKITDENVELRKRLLRTRRALEDTLHRLTLANKQKKEVEKSICKQIHQTSQVLRKAKANLDSGSEGDGHKN